MSGNSGRGYDHLPEHRRRIYTRDACTDFDELIEQSFTTGSPLSLSRWPDGTPITDEADAWRLLGKLANCKAGRRYTIRRNQGDGLGPRQAGDGTWEAWFAARDKDEGREHIAARAEAGEPLAYNPARRRARGKYICPQCHHRRSRQPQALCADCAATAAERRADQAAAGQRAERDRLARRQFGEDWDDKLNWLTDHALAPPRTPREQADRPLAEQARQHIGLEQRTRQRAETTFPWEERTPRPPGATNLAGKVRRARQAAADRIEASRIEDPALREMLGRWRNTR